jgi:hypothetical protein
MLDAGEVQPDLRSWRVSTRTPLWASRRLVVRIADALERVELLYADDLRALMDPDREASAA